MRLIVQPDGVLRCIYTEELDLQALGSVNIKRASHVEPTPSGEWQANLSPVGGPMLGPFAKRAIALAAETQWLNQHWLTPS